MCLMLGPPSLRPVATSLREGTSTKPSAEALAASEGASASPLAPSSECSTSLVSRGRDSSPWPLPLRFLQHVRRSNLLRCAVGEAQTCWQQHAGGCALQSRLSVSRGSWLLLGSGDVAVSLRFLQRARKAHGCHYSLNVASEYRQIGLRCGSNP